MKSLLPVFICVFFTCIQFSIKADTISDSYKNKPYNLRELGEFGEHLIKMRKYTFSNLDSAYFYIEKAEDVMNPNSDLEKVIYYFHKCALDHESVQFDSHTMKIAKEGLEISEKNGFNYYRLKFHQNIAEHSFPDKEAIYDHHLQALELAKQTENKTETMRCLMNITMHLTSFNKTEEARGYLSEIRTYLQEKKYAVVDYIRYHNHASNLENTLEASLLHLDSAITLAQDNNSHLYYSKLLISKAFLYQKYEKYHEAIKSFDMCDSLLTLHGFSHLTDGYGFLRAKFYLRIKDVNNAIKYFEKHASIEDTVVDNAVNYWGHLIYMEAKDTSKAFVYYSRYIEEVLNEKDKREDSLFVEFQNKHKVEKMKSDNLLKTERLKRYAFQNNMIIAFSALGLFILGFLYYSRNKKNKYKLETTKNILEKEQELNAYRIRFMENMTHEIRTPLTILKGIFDFLQVQLSKSKYSNLIEIGFKNSEQLKYDFEQILHSLAVEPYSKSVQNTPTNLLWFFTELIEQHKIDAFSKGVDIQLLHNLSNLTSAELDTDKWAVIFKNYFTNAVKYSTESGTIKIDIHVSKNHLKLSVENFGSVIKKEEEHKVFNRYYQINDKGQSTGFGIGLSIVKELAEIMQAHIGVTSDIEKQSTTFTCELQTEVQHFNTVTKSEHFDIPYDLTHEPLEQPSKEKPTLLVVDDNELMISFYKQILLDGFTCDFTQSGEEALNLIKSKNYACILTDVMMPDIDGFKLVERINSNPETKLTPVIFITANHIEETKIDAFRIGVHDFITKPFVVNELIVRIHNVIKNNENRVLPLETTIQVSELQSSPSKKFNDDQLLLDKIIATIDKNISDSKFSIDALAESVFYSSRQLTRKTKELTGLTPSKLIMERRLMKAEYILKTSLNIRISEVQSLIGISSTSYFNRAFKERFGIPPREVRRK